MVVLNLLNMGFSNNNENLFFKIMPEHTLFYVCCHDIDPKLLIIGIGAVFVLIRFLLTIYHTYLVSFLSNHFWRLLSLSMFYEAFDVNEGDTKIEEGEVLRDVFEETKMAAGVIVGDFLNFANDLIIFIVVLSVLTFTNQFLGLTIFIFLLLGGLIFYVLTKRYLIRTGHFRFKSEMLIRSSIMDAIRLGEDLMQFQMADKLGENLNRRFTANVKTRTMVRFISSSVRPTIEAIALLLGLITVALMHSTILVIPAEITAMAAYAGFRLLPTFSRMGASLSSIFSCQSTIKHLYEKLNLISDNPNVRKIRRAVNVSFSKNLVERLSTPGTILVHGPSGSGKSVTVKTVLPQIFELEQKFFSIYLDGSRSFVDGAAIRSIVRGRDRKDFKLICDRLELTGDVLWQHADTLSDGEVARVKILRALLLSPNVLVLDEVLDSIEARLRDKILNWLVFEINLTNLIIISHNPIWYEKYQFRTLKVNQ